MYETVKDFLQCQMWVEYLLECQYPKCFCASIWIEKCGWVEVLEEKRLES